jgi:hypothetical protein
MSDLARNLDPDDEASDPQGIDSRGFGDLESTIVARTGCSIPPQYRAKYEAGMTGKSRKSAVRTFCLECMGWSAFGVRKCTSPGCPLFPYRITG